MNMFVRCALVLVLTVALVQTLKCYNCKKWPTEKPTPTPAPAGGKRTSESKLKAGVCKDGELGELLDCEGVCFKGLKGG